MGIFKVCRPKQGYSDIAMIEESKFALPADIYFATFS